MYRNRAVRENTWSLKPISVHTEDILKKGGNTVTSMYKNKNFSTSKYSDKNKQGIKTLILLWFCGKCMSMCDTAELY